MHAISLAPSLFFFSPGEKSLVNVLRFFKIYDQKIACTGSGVFTTNITVLSWKTEKGKLDRSVHAAASVEQ